MSTATANVGHRALQALFEWRYFLIGPALVLALWSFAAGAELVSPRLLPGPGETLAQLFTSTFQGSLPTDFLATLERTLTAILLAVAIGVPLGVALGASHTVYSSVEFVVDFFRSTPATAMFPLFILIFGLNDTTHVAVAAFAACLVIIFNCAYGVMNARKTRVQAAKVMGASRWRVFKDVMLYESLPQTFVGVRTSVSLALVVIIVAEMFIGADDGLGRRIIDAQQVYDLREVYATILATGIMGYGFNGLSLAMERFIVRWKGH
ncbi:ABC transporter permease [Aquisalimonas sp. 2447]|uniref:ABC transporter permease n=1 Tax=Aquisalimonas sp. 2447 TaxID=2740807 RepID=UPI0014323772|nr:ABC transporter permease [Aquisalimonas sp. 2447]QIT54421.1 ABC transporter permease [Aquisalimonas sp. 2447]